MPELPEVETVVRGLREILPGKKIVGVKSVAPPSLVTISPSLRVKRLHTALRGRTVGEITRRGKNILISLSGDLTLWVHLKMTGKFRYVVPYTHKHKHDLVFFDLSTDNGADPYQLRFNDYRRFGRLRLYPIDELWHQPGLGALGPEPLELDADEFVQLCHRRPRMFKPALLDQTFVAGLGNIYADESLFLSRLHPKRLTTSVSKKKLRELLGHIQFMLKRSIRLMGTTVDTYSGVNGRPGSFQNYLMVYNREGMACVKCGSKIIREKIGSRSAHYCRKCQRVK